MGVSEPHLDRQLARRLLEETIQQLQNPLFLLQSVEEVAQFFPRQMQIQANQVARAVHVNLGRHLDVQKAFRVEQRNALQQSIVGGVLLLQTSLQISADIR